jgi:glucokinase
MEKTFIGVDLGGTKVHAARVMGGVISKSVYRLLPKDNGDAQIVVNLIMEVVNLLMNEKVSAIGIGLPSMVDSEKGIVYDVQNIPSWKEVHLAEILESQFHLPVFMDNDANCYALGEAYYGLGKDSDFMVGLTIGTGLGGGIVCQRKIINGASGSSGEFGIIPYLDKTLEDYCSGQFFKDYYASNGEELAKKARAGDVSALKAFQEFGLHLGNAIKVIMATVDPQMIVIGGSVALSNDLFEKAMRQSISDYAFERSIKKIKIQFSETNHMAILGASSLCFQNEFVLG